MKQPSSLRFAPLRAVVLPVAALLAGCSATSPAAVDLASGDHTSLTFRDGGRRDGGAAPDARRADGLRDGNGDLDLPGPELATRDLPGPDTLAPDLLAPDTLAHRCTTFAEFKCVASSFIVKCTASCTDHLQRALQIGCVGTTCSCQVDGKTKKTCSSGATKCSACQQAFACCGF